MTTKKVVGLSVIGFFAAIAGVVVSTMLLREDVYSTAKTVFEYFPTKFGVTPSATWEGALVLGIFTSVLQIVAAYIVSSDKFSPTIRWIAAPILGASMWFDNWTDVIFRSGYGAGNTKVATVSTLAFYTFGSEVLNSFSLLVVFSIWRSAISDLMWGTARLFQGVGSIAEEWVRFLGAAKRAERKDRGFDKQEPETPGENRGNTTGKPVQQTRSQRPPERTGQSSGYNPIPVEKVVQPSQDVPEFLSNMQGQNGRGQPFKDPSTYVPPSNNDRNRNN